MATQIVISDGLLDSMADLAPVEQAQVMTFARKLRENPRQQGLDLHRVDKAPVRGMWSGRVNDDMRVILHQERDAYVLLHVDHHDAAYRWAERRRVERHPTTGELQVVEVRETVREVEKIIEKPVAAPLFARYEHPYLASLGVPADWTPVVRAIATDEELLEVAGRLPREVGERLLELASGTLVTPPAPVATTAPIAAAAAASTSLHVVDDSAELNAILAAPLDRWIAFLHPSQRALVEIAARGPVKVTGSAGTGKTVVAMHRAVHLARAGRHVLLTSFVTTLCENLRRSLAKLCEPAVMEHVAVTTVHKQALAIVRSAGMDVAPAREDDVRDALEHARKALRSPFDAAFVWSEWEGVVQRHGLANWASYRGVRRTGRGHPLSVTDRKVIWRVFDEARAALGRRHLVDWATLCVQAERALASGGARSPFDAVVVDEVQDLRAADLRFLRALAAGRPDGLFLCGDAGQRIYAGGFSLGALGIDVRGRSHVLRINYRTTDQIRRVADRLLGAEVDDLDEGRESRLGTRSLLRGPPPELESFASSVDEVRAAAAWAQAQLARGRAASDLACFARTHARLAAIEEGLRLAGVETCDLEKASDGDGVRLGTMHRAKGLEFKAVLVADVGATSVPNARTLAAHTDPADREAAEARERQLLYVAMTRGRDALRITWHGKPSPFLAHIQAANGARP